MAAYNADIQIGVQGINNLRTLEQQLNRVSNSAKKISQTLKGLKVNQQTVKINTKGAITAVKDLEQRLNKLSKPVNVDVRYRETRRGSRASQPSGSRSTGRLTTPQAEQTQVVEARNNKVLQVEERRKKVYEELNQSIQKRNKLLEQQQKNIRDLQAANKGADAKERFFASERVFGQKAGNKRSIGQAMDITGRQVVRQGNAINKLNVGIAKTQRKYEALTTVSNNFHNEERRRVRQSTEAWGRYTSRLEKAAKKKAALGKAGRGAATAGGVAASSALSGIPGLGGAATGATIGFAVGGLPGAASGALAGGVVEATAAVVNFGAEAVNFNNQLKLMRLALANTVDTTDEYKKAIDAIDNASRDFVIPIQTATQQFTKLNAAARASGSDVAEVEQVFRGLAAANLALGGNTEQLNGILLATTQVFSKGRVMAEELRGQIGERLSGAFSKFAKSAGLTTSQLDEALRKGEISVEDFVRFSKSLLDEYDENAQVIGDAPENAAARLTRSMEDLKQNLNPILKDIGQQFFELAETIIKEINRAIVKINELSLKRQIDEVNRLRKVEQADQSFATNTKDFMEPLVGAPFIGGLAQFSIDDTARNASNSTKRRKLAEAELKKMRDARSPLVPPTGKEKGDRPDRKDPPETKTRNGGSRAGSTPADTVARTRVAIQMQRELLSIERKRFDLIGQEASLKNFGLEREELQVRLANDLALIKQENLTKESKAAESDLKRLEYQTDLAALANREQRYRVEQTRAFEDQIQELQRGIELESATTDEMRRQLELKNALADLEGTDLNPERKAELKALIKQRKELADRNADPIFQYMNQLKNSITDTRGQIVSLAQTIESELATAMSSAVTGLIDGTTTVQEAFSSMLKNIGKAFIDMAMKILAQKAILAILGAFAGGGNTMGGGGYFNQFTGLGTAGPNFGLALGGPVTPKKPYLVGETGPELFIPSESGIIGTNAMFDAAAGAIKSGQSVTTPEDAENDGGATNPFAAAAGALVNTTNTVQSSRVVEMQMAQNAAIENPEPIDIKFQSTVINNVSYVSTEEFQAGLTQTANRARSMTLKDLRQKPSTRRSAGVA